MIEIHLFLFFVDLKKLKVNIYNHLFHIIIISLKNKSTNTKRIYSQLYIRLDFQTVYMKSIVKTSFICITYKVLRVEKQQLLSSKL